jgi:UDP-GlcNAc:undecaprenyl-phosphate GlcNAc-1-phosphate transferase
LLPANLPLLLSGAFVTALALSLMGTYVVRSWAVGRGYVDHPDDARRIHSTPTPNVGGIAVAVATLASFLVWGAFAVPDLGTRPEILAMLGGGAMIFALGLWDDIHHLGAATKFAAQVAIASIVFFGGVKILGVGFGNVWHSQLVGVVSWAATVLWIVGTANAFNLIDGSDGVAGGAAVFASMSMGIVFALYGDPLGALMATILVGATLGFLFFNFPPATVFMGDCGSLFLGFTLATLGVITTQKASTLVAVAIPIVAFGVPLLDTLIAIVRRYLRHEPIFAPDRGHIHHRLRDLGLSSRGVAVMLYIACAGCASLSMALAAPGRTTVLPVFVVAGAVLVVVVQRLNVPELTELSRVVHRGFQQRSVISHNVRMHQLEEELSSVRSGAGLLEALRKAFGGSEFSAVELWLSGGYGDALLDAESLQVQDGGTRLRLELERPLRPDLEFEIRLPVVVDGVQIGRLSLFRTTSGRRLFTDVRLVGRLVTPTLASTLGRLSAEGSARETETGH